MSVEFYRVSPGKFVSGTLSRKTLGRWTGRTCACRAHFCRFVGSQPSEFLL